MKSKTSYFSSTLFFNTIKRFWPIYVAYLAIWIMTFPLALTNQLKWANLNSALDLSVLTEQAILTNGSYIAPIMAAVFSLLFAMAAFSYLYSSRSVSMYCSLPVKREGVFLSMLSTGLVGMLVSNVIVFIITIIVQSSYQAPCMNALWQWLALSCLNCLFFYGFAAFCASLTGHILVLPCVYTILNFVVVVVEYFVRSTVSGICYGMSSNISPNLGFLSPFYNLAFTNHVSEEFYTDVNGIYTVLGYYYDNWLNLIIYGAVGIVFALLAMILIKNRRMETAGDVVAVKPLRPIFKYCMALGCALILGVAINVVISTNLTFYSYGKVDVLILILCMLVGAFIGYFAAEMLMRKTLRVFQGRNWIGYSAACAVILALMLACEFDMFGFERNVPDASEVEYVTISGSFEPINLNRPENIQATIDLHKNIVNNKRIYENHFTKMDYSTDYNGGDYPMMLRVSYSLKNGKTLTRLYDLYTGITDDCDALSEIVNCDEAVEDRKSLDVDVNKDTVSYAEIGYFDTKTNQYTSYALTPEEATDLFNKCIVPDIDSRALGNIWLNTGYSTVNGKNYYDEVYACTIIIELRERLNSGNYTNDYFNTTLTVSATNTLKWIEAHGIHPILEKHTNVDEKGMVYTEKSVY